MILDDVRRFVDDQLTPWAKAQGLAALPPYMLEEPPAGIEGDVACNVAMLLAKTLKKAPRAIAQELQALLSVSNLLIEDVRIAGAGFLNFRYTVARLHQEVEEIQKTQTGYGRFKTIPDPKKKILIEFVSANPTGPLHVGHGRGAALGDSLALILAHLGYPVSREYYINDAGNQVQLLGESVRARCLEMQGKPFTLPVEGYHGDYVRDIAKQYLEHAGDADDLAKIIQFSLHAMQQDIQKDLEDFGVRFDSWFSEQSLVEKKLVEKHIAALQQHGFVQEYEDAVWFVAPGEKEEENRDKNRVLRRRDGRWTYFATDIAYHADKFERGFDRLIDVWGADHHGYVARVKGSMQALGHDPEKLHILLYQLVSLSRGGAPVSMSKRSGDFIMLREVLEEVGKDACRFFFAMRGPNTAFDFDLELAKKHTNDNPVYYLQYAHARICSIFRQAESPGAPRGRADSGPPLHLLIEKEERELMKRLALFPQTLRVCAQEDSPHPLATYLLMLCRQFHHFYDHHRVLGEDAGLSSARLVLLDAVRQVLRLGLHLLGVSTPESM
ncbi:MAG: arginine--tRNA ligase [Elusimicrobiota bacterium]|jgi:arginyl-tRNA synthetase